MVHFQNECSERRFLFGVILVGSKRHFKMECYEQHLPGPAVHTTEDYYISGRFCKFVWNQGPLFD